MWLKWKKTFQEKSKEGRGAQSFQKTWLWKFATGSYVRDLRTLISIVILRSHTVKFYPGLCKTDSVPLYRSTVLYSANPLRLHHLQLLAFHHSVTVLTLSAQCQPLYTNCTAILFKVLCCFLKKKKKESMAF